MLRSSGAVDVVVEECHAVLVSALLEELDFVSHAEEELLIDDVADLTADLRRMPLVHLLEACRRLLEHDDPGIAALLNQRQDFLRAEAAVENDACNINVFVRQSLDQALDCLGINHPSVVDKPRNRNASGLIDSPYVADDIDVLVRFGGPLGSKATFRKGAIVVGAVNAKPYALGAICMTSV